MKIATVSVLAAVASIACGTAPSSSPAPSGSEAVDSTAAALSTVSTLASGAWYPQYVAVDATNVYWTACPKGGCYQAGAAVLSCAIAGCGNAPTTLWTAGPGQGGQYQNPGPLAVDATSVYFTYTLAAALGVVKVPIGGGAATTLATGLAQDTGFSPIALDAGHVYFRDASSGVARCGIGGCPKGPDTIDASGNGATSLAINPTDTRVFFMSASPSAQVDSVGVAGAGPASLVTGLGGTSRAIAVARGNAFWASGNAIQSCALGGCANTPTTLATGCSPGEIVAAGVDLFVSNLCGTGKSGNLSYVMKVPQAGGKATRVVQGQLEMSGIAVDATNVYWGTFNLGATTPGAVLTAAR